MRARHSLPGKRFPEVLESRETLQKQRKELQGQGYYIADLHVHSAQSDGLHSLKSVVARCIELGISAAVTDHNRTPDLSGLSPGEISHIIPAIEITSREAVDILCYFYDFASLELFYQEVVQPHIKNSYMVSLSCGHILLALKQQRCVVTIPHPDYPSDSLRENFIRILKKKKLSKEALSTIHCIEVFNSSREAKVAATKKQLAIHLNKYAVAGSDAHTRTAIGNALTFCKAQNHTEFLDQLAAGQTESIAIPTRMVDRSLPKLKMAWLHIKRWF